MDEFDVIIGMDETTLNRASSQLYGRSDLRTSLFSGSQTQNISGVVFSVQWDIGTAPEIMLIAPSAQDWQSSIKADGSVAQPLNNAFLLNFPQVGIKMTAPENKETVVKLGVICTANTNGNQLAIRALAVIVDLSGASPIDQSLYKMIIIPQIINTANLLVSGISLPALSIKNISLSSPVISIQNRRCILFSNLVGRAMSPISTGNWPNKPLFILCSSRFVQQVGNTACNALRGQTVDYSGSQGFGVGDASYKAGCRVNNVAVAATNDSTVLACHIAVDAQASAKVSIDIPIPMPPIPHIPEPW